MLDARYWIKITLTSANYKVTRLIKAPWAGRDKRDGGEAVNVTGLGISYKGPVGI
jgi:hypothetical protein